METFRLFRKICGDDAMKNVMIVTNMWEEVDAKVGLKREEEIKSNFFKDAFDHGAQMCRHYGTPDSAKDIVRQTLQLDPRVLRVQDEMVKEKKSVPDTDAGIQLLVELDAETERRQKEIRNLRSELDALGGAHDDEVAKVKASIVNLEEMLEKIRTERYNLSVAVTEAIIARSTFNASKAIGPDDGMFVEGITRLACSCTLYHASPAIIPRLRREGEPDTFSEGDNRCKPISPQANAEKVMVQASSRPRPA